jgi:hypothetical protein
MTLLSALIISTAFQLGYGQSDFALWEDTREAYITHNFITPEFNVEARLGMLYIGGGVRVPVVRDNGSDRIAGSFKPIQASFPFTAGIKGNHFDVGYKYSCHHPFFIYLDGDAYNKTVKSRVEGGVWEVFIKVNGSFHPFR